MFLVCKRNMPRFFVFLMVLHFLNASSQNLIIDNKGAISQIPSIDNALLELDEKELPTFVNNNKFTLIEKKINQGITNYLLRIEDFGNEIYLDIAFKYGSVFAISQMTVSMCESSYFHNNLILDKCSSSFERICFGAKINAEFITDVRGKFKCEIKKPNYSNTKILDFEPVGASQIKITSLDLFLVADQEYVVSNDALIHFDNNDILGMVQIFIKDCKNNGINFPENLIKIEFEKLHAGVLGLSYGMNNDNLIDIRIDRQNWLNSSAAKRWYVLYHELGHDLLNFEHGNGGRMMDPIADRGYSWKEFWRDRAMMFEEYYLE